MYKKAYCSTQQNIFVPQAETLTCSDRQEIHPGSQMHFQQNLIEVKPFAIPKPGLQQSPLQLIRLVRLV